MFLKLLAILLLTTGHTCRSQVLVNHKGTKIYIDTSKWTLEGSSMYNKNTATVGIGTVGTADINAALEIKSTDKGILIPRIALAAKNSPSPLSNHTAGMLVYNIATAGSSPDNVLPGFYYNTGSAWARVLSQADVRDTTNDSWKEDPVNTSVQLAYLSDGSTARGPGREFLIKDDGKAGIGIADPKSTLEVNGSLGMNIRLISTATTLDESYCFVVMQSGSSLTLPPAISCPGRVYFIKNSSGSNKTIVLSGTSTTVRNNDTITCVSDGSTWHRFGTAP